MADVAALGEGLPTRSLRDGDVLLSEGAPGGAMYLLVRGTLEVRKGGALVTTVSEPGSFLGEMSALLGTAYSADVVAVDDVEVLVVDDAAAAVAANPKLTLEIARLLARRLHAVTSYLGDLKRQYAGVDGHLGMMDQVLSELVTMRPASVEPGSERGDLPDY